MSMETLERRAVTCRHWRWMAGMRVSYVERLGGRWHTRMIAAEPSDALLDSDPVPDLTDPATLGCLLALVREAYDDEHAHVRPCAGVWVFYTLDPMAPRVTAPTEAAALVAALEAAP